MQDTLCGPVIVHKYIAINDNQGLVTPLFKKTDSNEIIPIDPENYPAHILISKNFPDVEKTYDENELFLLQNHYLDTQKTEEFGSKRYWAKVESVCNLETNTMLPILVEKLPEKEAGMLPEGVTPPRGTFFLRDENKIYGPLTSSELNNGRYIIEPLTHPSLSLGKDYLGLFLEENIKNNLFRIEIQGYPHEYISSIKELSKHLPDKIDYMADDRLLKFFNQQGFGKNFKGLAKKEAERLQLAITQSEKTYPLARSERLERLKAMLDRYLKESDIGADIIKTYLSSSAIGLKFLRDYVEVNKSTLLKEHIDKIEAEAKTKEAILRANIIEQENQVKNKTIELEKINHQVIQAKEDARVEIANIQAETQEQAKKSLEEKQEALSQEVTAQEEELKKLVDEISKKTHKLNIANDIERMKSECVYYEKHKEHLKSAVKGFEDALKDPESLASRMGEMEVISRVLNGGSAEVAVSPSKYRPVEFTKTEPENGAELIELLCNSFEDDSGRPFSKDEMTNLIVSISQSYMTVLSGPPGIGKTSTVTRLANALHLGDIKGDQNFLYVPVGRGWVSGRDILGFYNSLKGVYQESRTGLYDFLTRINKATPNQKTAPQLVLLDEANLSSIEHYWSDFLGMCDPEGRNRPIDTGNPNEANRYLQIGNQVRFIATINNDSTTERLSPRLIDRVPVISLHQANSTPINNLNSSLSKMDGAISSNCLFNFFKPDESCELTRANEAVLDQAINILQNRDSNLGQTVNISHRKRIAITNYCSVAGEYIGQDSAMDFAISQHILPHIEGHGTKFRNRIQELSTFIGKSHPRANLHLERILSGGNDFTGTYSFF
ncbi:AAA family ATPase [Iodobacter arcticus]|uniref:AAA family ATPase n=1 Tax=Iodobacter arcticus TaxID=590593 RepID=A0ABW2QY69_9NEIS